MGAKTEPKTEPETGPLKKGRSSEKKILCSKKGSEMGAQKGGQCEDPASSMLRNSFWLNFGTSELTLDQNCTREGVGGRVNPPKIGRLKKS